MLKKRYFPTEDSKLLIWLKNFAAKFAQYAGLLGFTPAEATAVNDDSESFEQAVTAVEITTAGKKKTVEFKNILRDGPIGTPLPLPPATPAPASVASVAGIKPRIAKIVRSIKANGSYNDAIGDDMKIIGEEDSPDIENAKPVITLKKVETGWRLSFNLEGFFDGVKIFRTRPGQPRTFLAVDTSSPYIDTDAQVNGTSYTAFFLLGDDTVGLESDPVVISI